MTAPHNTNTRRPGFWLRAIEFRKHELTRTYRASLGDTAREGISDADYATTMATLEKMAVNLGWDNSGRPDHGFDGHPGRGHRRHGIMRGFGGPHRHHEARTTDSTAPSETDR